MATTFNYEVDTSPMAASLLQVAEQVDGTTKAVAVSASMLAKAEEAAAFAISGNISKGFLKLILSQLVQKKAAKRASVDAKNAQLVAEKLTAKALEQQFIQDFQRIKRRYHRLFETLNRDLKIRIEELDKPIFQLVEREYREKVLKRLVGVAVPVVAQQETGDSTRQLETGKAKGQITKLLRAMNDFLLKTQHLKYQIHNILLPQKATEVVALGLPSVIIESAGFLAGSQQRDVHLPKADNVKALRDLENQVSGLNWSAAVWRRRTPEERQALEARYLALIDKSSLSDREKDMAVSFFQASVAEVLIEVQGVTA